MAGGTTTGTKVSTKATTKKKVIVKVAFFGFIDHTGAAASATPIDMEAGALKLKQMLAFIPPADAEGNAAEEADAYLTIWEMKDGSGEKAPYEILRIEGTVKKDDGYNFRPKLVGGKLKIDQQVAGKPLFKQAGWAAAGKTDKIIMASMEYTALDGAKSSGEFVLPPLEYDEKLELQLGGGLLIGGQLKAHEAFAVGQCKVANGTFAGDCDFPIADKTAGIAKYGVPSGNLNMIVVHCMCAIYVKDLSSESYDVDACVKIFKDNGVSAHFIIDRAGAVTQCVPVLNGAPHAGGSFNTRSIGIELLGLFDGARDQYEAKYKAAMAGKTTLESKRAAIRAKLIQHRAAKASGAATVIVAGKPMPVDTAIANCEAAVADLTSKIDNFDPGNWARDWEQNVLVPADPAGVPFFFRYTDAQYDALGKLCAILGRRYDYNKVASHHKLAPDRKTDPGIYFMWNKLEPYLLPGTMAGSELHGGGLYTVE